MRNAEQAQSFAGIRLPKVPPNWRFASVSELGATDQQSVLTGPFGTSLGRRDFCDGGVPVLTIGCLSEQGIRLDKALYVSAAKAKELDRYRLRTGDLLFSRMASVGRAGIVGDDLEGALFNYHIMRLRLDETKILPKLFTQYVRGAKPVRDYLLAVNHGATRDGINTEQLLAMPVIVAPISEQRRIVAEIEKQFTRLDAGVAALRRVQANLKRYRAAVLKAACEGRLVPTEAEWTHRKLCEVTSKIGSGSTPRGGEVVYRDSGIPLIRSMNVHSTGFRFDGLAFIDDAEARKLDHVIVTADDVLLNITGASIGRVTTAPASLAGARVNQHVCIIRPDNELVSTFLAMFLASPDEQSRIMNVQVGATRQALTKAMVMNWEVPVPPLADQTRIVADVERRLSVVEELQAAVSANLQRAIRLRQSILKQAFSAKTTGTDD